MKTCPGCGTLFHRDCREGLAKCPSLGCSAATAVTTGVQVQSGRGETQAGRWPVRRLYAVAFGILFAVIAWMPIHPSRVEAFVVAMTAGYAGLFLLRNVVAHVREERGRGWRLHVGIMLSAPIWAYALAQFVLLVAPDPYLMRH
jgi:hypothetical protein